MLLEFPIGKKTINFMSNKITALIPTYRRPELLQRAMLSVLGQSYKNIQLSVFDNASNDNTKDVVNKMRKIDDRIKYNCNENNIGALANFRLAFESVDTPYFSILSDDDCLAEDFYKNAIDVLDNHPEIMFVILNTFKIDENSNLINDKECTNKLSFYKGKIGFDAFHSGNIPQIWTGMVFRKEVAKIYDEMDTAYDDAHDMRFLLRAISRYDFAYLSKVGALFTVHSDSASSALRSVNIVDQGVQISRYVEIFHDENVPSDIKDRTIFYIKRLLSTKPSIFEPLLKIFVNFIVQTDFSNKKIEENIKDFKYAGYNKSSNILNLFHKSKTMKILVRIVFGSIYRRRLSKRQSTMLSLQNSVYKKYFDYIKDRHS
tara:strand:- start:2243 stop:3364 length:1122 start_codon:yes stop_codon:yes gene_type:complete